MVQKDVSGLKVTDVIAAAICPVKISATVIEVETEIALGNLFIVSLENSKI